MNDPVFPIFAGIAIFLVLLPAPWHYEAGNSGTLLYITWTVVGNLIFMTNSIIWSGNLGNPVPIWCDITSKLIIGLSVALPAASLCINRRLYKIATIQQVVVTAAQKRRDVIIDLLIGLGLPALVMALHYVVQGHRYNILEDIGCWPSTYNTPPAIPLVMMWPILLGIVSFIYCSLSIRAFIRRRASFNAFLSSSNSGLNISRYFRLMALASVEMIFSLPMSLYHLIQDVRNAPLHPWISWEDTHWGFDRVDFVPFAFFRSSPLLWIDINIGRWSLPFGGFVFFIFFGLAPESRRNYVRIYYSAVRLFGILPPEAPVRSPPSWLSRLTPRHVSMAPQPPTANLASPRFYDSTKVSGAPSIPDIFIPALESKSSDTTNAIRREKSSESECGQQSDANLPNILLDSVDRSPEP